jgi:5-methylcytosine-specific restriction endonuclease McrA
MSLFRRDVEQEIALLQAEFPGEVVIGEWTNLVQRRLYSLAVNLGFKKPKGEGRFVRREIAMAFLLDEEEQSDDKREERAVSRIEIALASRDWTEGDLWAKQAYEFCREVLGGDFVGSNQRNDWALFSAWLDGWSREELCFAFGLKKKQLKPRLQNLADRIRQAAKIDSDEPVPMPKRIGVNANILLKTILQAGEKPVEGRPRFVVPQEWSTNEIQKRFWVSYITAWRARTRGWLVPGHHIPDHAATDTTEVDLSTSIGRTYVRRQLAARDGWWVEYGNLWVKCGICGKPILASVATIDHIIPRSEGGPDVLGNFQLAHEECNFQKGSRMPDLLPAIFSRSQG